jgi:hypothetical protein
VARLTAPSQPGDAALDTLWQDLKDSDGIKAGKAMLALRRRGPESVAYLKARVQPVTPREPQRLKQLVADLDSERFAVREKAYRELEKLGDLAAAALKQPADSKLSLEGQRRANELLDKLASPVSDPDTLRLLRAVEVLEQIGTPPARAVLAQVATGMAQHRVTLAARAAIDGLDLRKSN